MARPEESGTVVTWAAAGGTYNILPTDDVRAVTVMDGDVYAGLHDAGVVRIDLDYKPALVDAWRTTSCPLLVNDTVTALVAADGRVLAGTLGGASLITPTPAADLTIDKTVVPAGSVGAGEALTYTLAFANQGAMPATGVVITDLLPTSLTDVAVASSVPLTPLPGVTYAWQIADLAASAGGTITVTGRTRADLAEGAWITNTAAITTTARDQQPGNNVVTTTLRISAFDHYTALGGQLQSDVVNDAFLTADYAYLATDAGLDKIRRRDHARVDWITRPGGFTSVVLYGGQLYLGTADAGLYRWDEAALDGSNQGANGSYEAVYTTATSPRLVHNTVHDVSVATIAGKVYVAVGTEQGGTLINETDSTAADFLWNLPAACPTHRLGAYASGPDVLQSRRVDRRHIRRLDPRPGVL